MKLVQNDERRSVAERNVDIEFISMLAVATSLVFAAVLLAGGMLQPVFAKASDTSKPLQFTIWDLGTLVLYLSVALAFGTVLEKLGIGNEPFRTAIWTASLAVYAIALWWNSTRAMQRASIDGLGRRIACSLVIVPLAYGGCIVAFLLMLPILLFLMTGEHGECLKHLAYAGIAACIAWCARILAEWVSTQPASATSRDGGPQAGIPADHPSNPGQLP